MNRFQTFLAGLAIAVGMEAGALTAHAAATEPYGLDAWQHFERLPYLKLDAQAGGQSSFDRNAHNGDCSNFLYTNGTEKVLLDENGPGTVYRIWFTGFDAAKDWIKVYFDGESTPRIDLPLRDLFSGTNAPFLSPLVGDDAVSSGGFYCYLPLPFKQSIRVTSSGTTGSFYYNFGYHLYSPDTKVITWSGQEDSSAVRRLWSYAGADPKSTEGNVTVTTNLDLTAGESRTLLELAGPQEITAIKFRIPGTEPPPVQPPVTDDGRAHKGYSQFVMAVDPQNSGVTLVRRLDYGVGNQVANVFVDGTLVGQWSNPGSDGAYHWRDSGFAIPAAFTTNKSHLTIKVSFVSSDNDWNELYYWIYSPVGGRTNLTDSLDVGNAASESSHQYVIDTPTWQGSRTFEYPPPAGLAGAGDLLTNLWLSIAYDGEHRASVLAPIGSFFSLGQFAAYPTRALPVGMDASANLYCYFPMPFAHRATVQLISRRNAATTNIQCEIAHRPFTDSFANVGYFKTQFRSEQPTTNGLDIVFLDTDGTGHLVGVVESMMGPLNRGYLEGNERFYVDDSHSPAINGTGTEDFYNGGWYFSHGTFSLPTHGNPNHLIDTRYDYTAAYRLLLADAVPFRKHILAGIQHGPADEVPINVWTLAYYYSQPTSRAELTDRLMVGDVTDERAHDYTIHGQTWNGSRTYTYEYEGDFTGLSITSTGRAHQGSSEFTLKLSPNNAGAILRRQFDQSVFNQAAKVYVEGKLVGTWYRAGGNPWHSWRDDDFQIPTENVRGKNAVRIRIEYVSSALDWNEFAYSLYTIKPTE